MRLLISILLLLSGGAAQTAPQSPVARKLVSYDDQIRSSEAEQWRLEDSLPAISAEPESKLYIIAYGGREDPAGKARRYAVRARNYFVDYHSIDPQRIVSVDGGRREEFIVEVWLVPKDAKPPEPSPTVTVPDDLGDNLFYDDFSVGFDDFALRTEGDTTRLDGFAAALKKEPNSWGCIVVYAMAGDDRYGIEWDPPGTALRFARQQRTYLVKKQQLPWSRLSVIDGGYGRRTVQLWVMRPRARFDHGPFLFSSRLKVNPNGTARIGVSGQDLSCCNACARSPQKSKGRKENARRN